MIGKGVRNRVFAMTQIEIEREIARIIEGSRARLQDPLIAYGYKVFAQCDEDGIIAEIFRRIGRTNSVCVEIGCGNGLENNTHALLLQSWKGLWIDGNRKNIDSLVKALGNAAFSHLILKQAWVTPETVNGILEDGLSKLGIPPNDAVDFLSIDIDSYDLAVLRALHFNPRVICVEYNAKFPPPIEVEVPYPSEGWMGDDYMGASLAALCRDLHPRGYRLVGCNVSGVNAFFVREDCAREFEDAPVERLYMPARYELCWRKSGHPPSLKYLRDILQCR